MVKFPKGRPKFNKVITVSFSIFDNFEHPDDGYDGSEDIVDKNYFYCGFHNSNGKLMTDLQRKNRLYKSWKVISNKIELLKKWKTLIGYFLPQSSIDCFLDLKGLNKQDFIESIEKLPLSSGQYILFYFITHVLANITEHSLLLFDEPELHLHPNAISIVIKMLYELLDMTDSNAIIATHSPIIVQQIPSKLVTIFSSIDESIIINRPTIETFGENLSTITRDIFENIDNDAYYKQVLKHAVETFSSEYVKNIFDNNLGLNATMFVENINGKI